MTNATLKIRNQQGMTLLEVILSISILAIIIGPFVNIFAFSAHRNNEAEKTLESTFVAQKRMESLQMLDYLSALEEGQGERAFLDGYYVETTCTPYHIDSKSYFQVVAYDGEDGPVLYAIPPSGDLSLNGIFFSADATLKLKIQDNSYTWLLEGAEIDPVTGILTLDEDDPVIVGMNLMQYTGPSRIRLVIDSDVHKVEVLEYVTSGNKDLIVYDGDRKLYKGYLYRVDSMLRAVVKVYKGLSDTTPIAVAESILSLRNQP